MDLKLKQKLALVTGSTAGIGSAIAELFGARGREGDRERSNAIRRRCRGGEDEVARPAARSWASQAM